MSADAARQVLQLFFSFGVGGTGLPFSSIEIVFEPSVEHISIVLPLFAHKGVMVTITDKVIAKTVSA